MNKTIFLVGAPSSGPYGGTLTDACPAPPLALISSSAAQLESDAALRSSRQQFPSAAGRLIARGCWPSALPNKARREVRGKESAESITQHAE
jgi:hypothetical protein